eukprot:1139053-Pelagomonas_calceolata.AAC.2
MRWAAGEEWGCPALSAVQSASAGSPQTWACMWSTVCVMHARAHLSVIKMRIFTLDTRKIGKTVQANFTVCKVGTHHVHVNYFFARVKF